MNLKNRFRLVIFCMALLLFSIAVIVAIGIRLTNIHVQETISMDDLIVNLYEMRILNSEYVSTPSERVKQQWRTKYEEIKSKLNEQTKIPDEVKDAFSGLQQVFERLTSIPDADTGMETSQKRLRNQIVTTLNLESQRIIDWASDISSQAKGEIVPHLILLVTFVLAVIMLVATVTITIMHVTAKSVFSSVSRLKEGAEEIASGNLGFQVKHVGNDEIAALATSINLMSFNLMDSYDNLHEQTVLLETEMAERQKANEALQQKTVELENEIAERIRIQAESARLQEQLLQSQKMEAIGLLAGGIAHDFNNILSVIMGYGEMLARTLPKGISHDHADQILIASERAAELTRGLLAFSRKQTFNLELTDINKLANDNIKFLKRVIGEDIELLTTFPPTPLYMLLDRSQIQQVFMNLATNARDAMPSGGKLIISIKLERLDGDVFAGHSSENSRNYAVIKVCDTGAGMDKETVERIFEPFFTTKEKEKGTGLGLSIIHGIIAQHHGVISCSSETGIGTTFSIYLPLLEEDVRQTVVNNAITESKSLLGCETILLAEDDSILLELTKNIFESNGYTVLSACDGIEALEIYRKQADEIDLVILDVVMPKMTGKQVWEEIRNLRTDVKTCFISGYINNLTEGGKPAVDDTVPFIRKPFMPDKLLEKVREILDGL